MKEHVLTSLLFLRPLAHNLWFSNCIVCDKPQARWEVRSGSAPAFLCGLCVLHETKWGKENQSLLNSVAGQIELHGNRKFERNPEGNLIHCKEADDLMGVVMLMDMTARRFPKEPR